MDLVGGDKGGENDRGREEQWKYLGATSGVLGCAACELDGFAVGEEVFVEAHVFVFGEDGIVSFEAVFL